MCFLEPHIWCFQLDTDTSAIMRWLFLSPQVPCLIFNLETDKTISTLSVTLYFSTSCIERRETHYERNLAERRVFTDTMPLERVTFERKEHEHKIGRRLETASGCVEALFFISI